MDTYHNKEISLRELPTGWENTGLFSQSQQYFPSFPCVFRITDGAKFCHCQQRVCFSLKTCVKKLNPYVKQSRGDSRPARGEGTRQWLWSKCEKTEAHSVCCPAAR